MAYAAKAPAPGHRQIEVSAVENAEDSAEEDETTVHDIDPSMVTRFVNLVDILPPLPEKGHFDVSTIKKSLYFFS